MLVYDNLKLKKTIVKIELNLKEKEKGHMDLYSHFLNVNLEGEKVIDDL